MRISKDLLRLGASFLALGLGFGQAVPGSAEESSAKKETKSLIRKDLLRLAKTEPVLPLRNIFAPQARPGAPVTPMLPPETAGVPADAPAEEAEAAPVFNINLRYIGFLESAKGLNALIILDGRAMSVAEGEIVGEGLRVGKITAQQIEIILPDSSTRTFSLEGE